MQNTNIKKLLVAIAIVFALAFVSTTLRSYIVRRSDGRRAAELERRAQQLEINLATANRIRTEALGALRKAESELSRLRDALRETEEHISGLRNENSRLRESLDELTDIRGELGNTTDELTNIAQRIGDGAREALGIMERLRTGSEGTN